MVSKKKRRRELARAATQRQTERRAHRVERNRRLTIVAWVVLAVGGVGGLSAWIVTHPTVPTVTPVQSPQVQDPLAQLGLATVVPTVTYTPSTLSETATPTPTKSPATKKQKAKESK